MGLFDRFRKQEPVVEPEVDLVQQQLRQIELENEMKLSASGMNDFVNSELDDLSAARAEYEAFVKQEELKFRANLKRSYDLGFDEIAEKKTDDTIDLSSLGGGFRR